MLYGHCHCLYELLPDIADCLTMLLMIITIHVVSRLGSHTEKGKLKGEPKTTST